MSYKAQQVAKLSDEAGVDTGVMMIQFLLRIRAADGYSWVKFLMQVGAAAGEYMVLHCW